MISLNNQAAGCREGGGMNKSDKKYWVVTKHEIGRELGNPDYILWADKRIKELELQLKLCPTKDNSGMPKPQKSLTQIQIGFTQGVVYTIALVSRFNLSARQLWQESGLTKSDLKLCNDTHADLVRKMLRNE